MKWLVVSSHDERYDFNLGLKTFDGTVDEFESSPYCDFNKAQRKELRNGIYMYHIEKRNDICENIDDEIWTKIKEHVEVVTFDTLYLIPFENFNDIDFVFQNGIVNRNLKFGFLDIIN